MHRLSRTNSGLINDNKGKKDKGCQDDETIHSKKEDKNTVCSCSSECTQTPILSSTQDAVYGSTQTHTLTGTQCNRVGAKEGKKKKKEGIILVKEMHVSIQLKGNLTQIL